MAFEAKDESKNEKIRKYFQQNPELLRKNFSETADKFNTSYHVVEHVARRMRKKMPQQEGTDDTQALEPIESGTSSFVHKRDTAEYTFNTSKRIISEKDLIAACDIDLTEWTIERFVCNKWEVGAKDANKQIQVTPLFQVKLWLKPKLGGIDYPKLIEEIVQKHSRGSVRKIVPKTKHCDKAIKITLSDIHIGLEPNPDGNSIYQYEYNSNIFNANLDHVYSSVLKEHITNGKFDLLIIDDLGDGLDAYDGMTTRKGHTLDQNMNNVEAFRVYVEGKLRLIENLIAADVANKILIRNVSDDNHSGDFGHVANLAIQMILQRSYSDTHVEFYILRKFIEHFKYGDHTFILTHGKDKKNMFKGFPLDLDHKTTNFLNEYINRQGITTKYIHVEKGDLHQISYKRTSRFDYRNFMSFAPPSAYVQNNFGASYSGYSIQIIPKYFNEISHTDYFFDLAKVI